MRPYRITFAAMALTAFLFSGCTTTSSKGFLGSWFASKKTIEENPQSPDGGVFDIPPLEKTEDDKIAMNNVRKPANDVSFSPMTSHNQETLTYINRELRDATPQEQETIFQSLKGLSADLVRVVLQTRRMSIDRDKQRPNRTLLGQNSSGTDHVEMPRTLNLNNRNNNDFQSPRSGDINSQNRTGQQQPPNGPYGYSGTQNRINRSQPVSIVAPDPRQPSSTTGNNNNNSIARNSPDNGLYPPPAPGVKHNRAQKQPSSPLNAIQTPQTSSIPSGTNNLQTNTYLTNNSEQRLSGSSQSSHSDSQGSNILWNEEILRIISLTESDVARMTPGTTDKEMMQYTEKHVFLRLLYLLADKPGKAFETIPRIAPEDSEFWQQTMWAIANYFNEEAMPDKSNRAGQTVAQMRTAIRRLEETAHLEIKNVAFCKNITNFGNFEKFDRDEFRPGDTVLIYAEVENFKSDSSEGGKFRTVMKSEIEILRSGAKGGAIDQKEYSPAEDFCSSPRRDYFHAYRYVIPANATLGPHVLKLTIEDQLGRKVASYTMNFTIK